MWTKPIKTKEPLEQDLLTFKEVFKARPKWYLVSAIDGSINKNIYRTLWIYDNKKNAEIHLKCMKEGYYGDWIDLRIYTGFCGE